MISACRRIANQPCPVTLLLAGPGSRRHPGLRSGHSKNVLFGHTLCFSRMVVVHSGLGDVIKKGTVTGFVGVQEEVALKLRKFYSVIHARGLQIVVSPHVRVSTSRRVDRMDGAADRQACHRRFRAANVMDGDRQGS